MRVGFVFDAVLLKKEKDFYGLTLTHDFFTRRYLDKIDEMVIITRTKQMEKYNGNVSGYKKTNGEKVEVFPIEDYRQIPDSVFKRSRIRNKLTDYIKRCDKMIIRMPSVLGLFACDICRKNNIPYMIEMVACAWDGYMNHTNKLGKLIAPIMFIKTKKRIKAAKYVLYVTDEFLQKRYPTKGKSYGCSDVEIKYDDKDVLQERYKKIENFNKKDFSCATVANVGMRYKGHIYALEAIKELKDNGINVKYYLAGNGNQQYLKNLISVLNLQDNVIFLGSLNHEKVFELLDNVDVYLQPSLQEGLPRALIEAMSRCLLCIGSNVGGIPELLDSKYIFQKRKSHALAEILKTITQEDLRIEGKRNYEKSKSFFAEKLDKKRNDIYMNFLGE